MLLALPGSPSELPGIPCWLNTWHYNTTHGPWSLLTNRHPLGAFSHYYSCWWHLKIMNEHWNVGMHSIIESSEAYRMEIKVLQPGLFLLLLGDSQCCSAAIKWNMTNQTKTRLTCGRGALFLQEKNGFIRLFALSLLIWLILWNVMNLGRHPTQTNREI